MTRSIEEQLAPIRAALEADPEATLFAAVVPGLRGLKPGSRFLVHTHPDSPEREPLAYAVEALLEDLAGTARDTLAVEQVRAAKRVLEFSGCDPVPTDGDTLAELLRGLLGHPDGFLVLALGQPGGGLSLLTHGIDAAEAVKTADALLWEALEWMDGAESGYADAIAVARTALGRPAGTGPAAACSWTVE